MSDEKLNDAPVEAAPVEQAVETAQPVVEQLNNEAPVEPAPVEESKVETFAEEPKEEPVVEEKEEPVAEAPVEEKKEELAVEPAKPEVNLEEQLSLIKEVRIELAKSYTESKALSDENAILKQENLKFKEELANASKKLEELSVEVTAFRAKEEEARKLAYTKRLEKLSDSFKELGQLKTVEELSAKDEKVIEELEAVVKIAVEEKAKEQLSGVVVPTQAIPEMKIVKTNEPLTHDRFLKNLGKAFEAAEKKY